MTAPAESTPWQRIEEFFHAALALDVPQRDAFLVEACAGDEGLRGEVLSLLEAHAVAEDALPTPTLDALAPVADASPTRARARTRTDPSAPGAFTPGTRRIGDCTLQAYIAHGGMGIVYEAIQDAPRRTVAVKVMLQGVDSEWARAHFEHEARTLGNLRHPGIAQIFGAGTHQDETGEQRPYFVMEYVPDARSLLEFANEVSLDRAARLRLFGQVCEAVHHGHQKGIIHRDLKPENILVDGEGRPKVIDFGIARTADPDADAGPARTRTGLAVGTLPYMSPEQLLGRRDAVDTRSDVYALGVVLYELLTGRRPHDLDGLDAIEAARRVSEHPPTPATRYCPDLQPDLRIVLEKALAVDADQRYASAAALRADVERTLRSEPIEARALSLTYQLRLFARRHRASVVGALGALLALVAGLVVSLALAASEARQRRVAQAEARRAGGMLIESQRVITSTIQGLYDRVAGLPGSLAARRDLVRSVRTALDGLALHAGDDPTLRRMAALSYKRLGEIQGGMEGANLGQPQEALESYERALAILEGLIEDEAGNTPAVLDAASVRASAGALHLQLGQGERGRRLTQRALDDLLALHARRPGDAKVEWNLANAHEAVAARMLYEGEAQGGLEHLEQSLALRKAQVREREDPVAAWRALGATAGLFGEQLNLVGRRDEALAHLEASYGATRRAAELAGGERALREDFSLAHTRIGDHHRHGGDAVQALDHFRQALAYDEVLAAEEPEDARAQDALFVSLDRVGKAYLQLDRPGEALAPHRRARNLAEARAERDPDTLEVQSRLRTALNTWGTTLLRNAKPEEAAPVLERALRVATSIHARYPASWPVRLEVAEALDSLGMLAFAQAEAAVEPGSMRALLDAAREHFRSSRDHYLATADAGRLPVWAEGVPALLGRKVAICDERLRALR